MDVKEEVAGRATYLKGSIVFWKSFKEEYDFIDKVVVYTFAIIVTDVFRD